MILNLQISMKRPSFKRYGAFHGHFNFSSFTAINTLWLSHTYVHAVSMPFWISYHVVLACTILDRKRRSPDFNARRTIMRTMVTLFTLCVVCVCVPPSASAIKHLYSIWTQQKAFVKCHDTIFNSRIYTTWSQRSYINHTPCDDISHYIRRAFGTLSLPRLGFLSRF